MSRPRRSRPRLLAWMAVLVVLGLGSRRGGMPDVVVLYAGDVLWGAFFFALGAFLRPGATPLGVWLGAVVSTELIEASQARAHSARLKLETASSCVRSEMRRFQGAPARQAELRGCLHEERVIAVGERWNRATGGEAREQALHVR